MTSPTSALSLQQLQKLAIGSESVDGYVLELLASLESNEEESRAWASDALEKLQVLPRGLADSVAAKCLSPHPPVAAWACKLLAKLESDATDYQAAIVACLDGHPQLSVRQQAALALASIPNLDSASIEALRRAADSHDPRLKRLATAALATPDT